MQGRCELRLLRPRHTTAATNEAVTRKSENEARLAGGEVR